MLTGVNDCTSDNRSVALPVQDSSVQQGELDRYQATSLTAAIVTPIIQFSHLGVTKKYKRGYE